MPWYEPISIFRLMSCWMSRRRSPSTLRLASIQLRNRVTSSSVRSRTRVFMSIPVASHTFWEVVRPIPKT